MKDDNQENCNKPSGKFLKDAIKKIRNIYA